MRNPFLVAIAVILIVSGCASAEPQSATTATARTSTQATTSTRPPAVTGQPENPELRRELLQMSEEDQAERTSPGPINGDEERTDRLREIIDEHGWPTETLVGADGASASWLITQHADFDVEFQKEALELMQSALEDGEVNPIDVAYLEDRVAVNEGRPQTYGTQVGGCEDGRAVPRPIANEETVDQRRTELGLEPLEEYLELFHENC